MCLYFFFIKWRYMEESWMLSEEMEEEQFALFNTKIFFDQ